VNRVVLPRMLTVAEIAELHRQIPCEIEAFIQLCDAAPQFPFDRVALLAEREKASDELVAAALLHDVGKIGVSDAILLKQGALNEDEWLEMRTHPEKGHRIVSQIPGMGEAAEIVLSHEERFDGSGYPRGLRGEQICLGARLFAVLILWTRLLLIALIAKQAPSNRRVMKS
jgi:hypothetical protein